MAAQDVIHDAVKNALVKDGWTITHDPFTLIFGNRYGFVDLGAEKILTAEKSGHKIAVEIKSFIGPSPVTELERSIGQYAVYKSWLARIEPERVLYLAVDRKPFSDLFEDISGQVLLEDYNIKVIVIDASAEEIVRWIN